MRYSFLIIAFLFPLSFVCSQPDPYLLPYQSLQNKYYWKHSPPSKDYWQQDVAYQIKATIDDSSDVINGDFYKLTYTNNSPVALKELYFHLYDNAYQKESHYHSLWLSNRLDPKFGKYEARKLGNTTDNWNVNGQPVKTELDNTILKLYLNQPLQPGESLDVTCTFKSYWDTGAMRRRSKVYNSFGFKHYDGVHWYPIICVYDKHFAWHTDQHLDKEYYADFGSFDVELTFPHDYIVEATGLLKNKDEVLPAGLREKIDLKNFRDKPFNSVPSIIIPREEGKTKTWKYYAVNVHNFAFTADPLYRIGETEVNGIRVMAIAQEPHASKWQLSVGFTAKVMDVYTKDFGEYIWPKIIVADANDGMEYPMLTLDGGVYPQHQYLLAHEVGHMWFYGMLGSNETYRASLDEGFTQFLTIWSMDKITGKKKFVSAPDKFMQPFKDSSESRMDRLYTPYLTDVWSGYDEPLNTHSSGFNSAIRQGGGYRLAYHKTGVMLYNLKYVLGDSLFLAAMQHYVKKWTGKHPYPEDFREAITEMAQTDLTWFFDQWMETTKFIDYKIEKPKKREENSYLVKFRRLGRMQMPLDFTITNDSGRKFNYHVPNNWFVKKTNAILLPRWYGWDKLHSTYTANITVTGKIKNIEIDTSCTLADIDLTNNARLGIDKWQIDNRVLNAPSWQKRKVYWRPALWWNKFDGLQLGANTYSDYFGQNYWQETSAWWNSRLLQTDVPSANKNDNRKLSVYFSNKFNLSKYWRQLYYLNEFQYNAGLTKFSIGFEKTFRFQDLRNPRFTKVFINHGGMYRAAQTDALYLIYPGYWSIGKFNSYINLGVQRNYPLKNNGIGELILEARTPGFASDFNYSYLQFTGLHNFNLKKIEIKTRLFGRLGLGNTPYESALYLAGASPEQLYGNKLTRAAGFVPGEWLGYGAKTNHFQMGGGLNVRGYAGYLAPVYARGSQLYNHVGKSGASLSLELDFDRFIPLKPTKYTKFFHIDTYLFHDMGFLTYTLNNETIQRAGNFRMSAGIGTALTLKLDNYNVKPLVIRFDVPLFLNAPAAVEDYVQMRYVIGINRSF